MTRDEEYWKQSSVHLPESAWQAYNALKDDGLVGSLGQCTITGIYTHKAYGNLPEALQRVQQRLDLLEADHRKLLEEIEKVYWAITRLQTDMASRLPKTDTESIELNLQNETFK